MSIRTFAFGRLLPRNTRTVVVVVVDDDDGGGFVSVATSGWVVFFDFFGGTKSSWRWWRAKSSWN